MFGDYFVQMCLVLVWDEFGLGDGFQCLFVQGSILFGLFVYVDELLCGGVIDQWCFVLLVVYVVVIDGFVGQQVVDFFQFGYYVGVGFLDELVVEEW